ncbi:MAG: hypothetical protein ACFFAS_20210 [Promethearchaeota archaeon]
MALAPTIPGLVLLSFILSIQLFIGIFLGYKTVKSRTKEVAYLSAFNIMVGVTFLLHNLMTFFDEEIWSYLFMIFTFIAQLLIIVFVKKVFYKQNKSPFLIILIISCVDFIIAIILSIVSPSYTQLAFLMSIIFTLLYTFDHIISGYWFGYISIKHYYKYKNTFIEPWIRKRYLVAGISALAFGNLGFPGLISVLGLLSGSFKPMLHDLTFLIRSILMIIYSVGSLIAWFMPKRLKIYFNKGYASIEAQEFSEEEIYKDIKSQIKEEE